MSPARIGDPISKRISALAEDHVSRTSPFCAHTPALLLTAVSVVGGVVEPKMKLSFLRTPLCEDR
ncbi:Protein of unknown function [Gryllus bimaculatus]|nr:Protein of unknown function [Gryllus bimaculatus]